MNRRIAPPWKRRDLVEAVACFLAAFTVFVWMWLKLAAGLGLS